MDAEWAHLIVENDRFVLNRGRIVVTLDRRRRHAVEVLAHEDGWELSGLGASADELAAAGLDAVELWKRNRYLSLVQYVLDGDDHAWVTAWLPSPGLTPQEFQGAVLEVAVEADRLEYHCTGRDMY